MGAGFDSRVGVKFSMRGVAFFSVPKRLLITGHQSDEGTIMTNRTEALHTSRRQDQGAESARIATCYMQAIG